MTKPLALVLAGALLLPLEGPRFAPEEGVQVQKTFTENTSLILDHAEFIQNGRSVEPPDELSLEIEIERELVIVDTYVAVGGGRPERLLRRFDDVSGTVHSVAIEGDGGTDETDGEYESPLDGVEVVFTWDEDGEAHGVAFGEDEGEDDTELLDGLVEDADLRALLPPEDVEEGDEWRIDGAGLAALLRPCGELHWVPIPDDGPDPEGTLFSHFLGVGEVAEEVDGGAVAVYAGTDDGVCVITAEVEVTIEREMKERMLELAEELEISGMQVEMLDEFRVSTEIEGTATLTWDLEAGLARSLEFEAALESTLEFSMGGGMMGVRMELSGQTVLALEAEQD